MSDPSLPRPTSRLAIVGLLLLVAGGLGWLLLGLAGQPPALVTRSGQVGARVEFYTDQGKQLDYLGMTRLPTTAWQIWPGGVFITAGRGTALWLRVTLHNPGERPQQGVLVGGYYFVDQAEAWLEEPGGSGPASTAPFDGRDLAFAVTVPARGTQVVWVRAEDFFKVFLRPVWWPDRAAFHTWQARGLLAEGIYFGGLFALLGYNTMLWLRLRLRDTGFYALYLSMVAAVMLLGRAYPLALGWRLHSPALETLFALALALSGFCLTQFAREFLELSGRRPGSDRLARALRGLMFGLAVFALATPWMARPYAFPAVVLGIGVTHVGLFVIAIRAWRTGVRQARFFVMSFGCLFASSLFSVLAWLGATALLDAAMLGLMIGSAAEMLLLSLAVADRFAQAQQRLVAETEQRRLIEETYADELELEVRERTQELEAANADKDRMLAVIGHDLRSPLTGLMRSADQASGEFAREAARTGRTLLLMIEDVVVWARLRAGSRGVAAHPAHSLMMPAIALHRSLAEHGGTELILDVPEELSVETDRVLVQTLVRNLLANALKFARTRVVLRAAADGQGGVRFTVGNDGPVLSAAVAARLAAGVDEPMTATGGLGLRLCREICQTLGLRLEAGTGADGGTEFSVTVPEGNRAETEKT